MNEMTFDPDNWQHGLLRSSSSLMSKFKVTGGKCFLAVSENEIGKCKYVRWSVRPRERAFSGLYVLASVYSRHL